MSVELIVIVSLEVLCDNVTLEPAISLTSSSVPDDGLNLIIVSFPLPEPVDEP